MMAQAPAPVINWVHVCRKETLNSFLLEHADDAEDGCLDLTSFKKANKRQYYQAGQ